MLCLRALSCCRYNILVVTIESYRITIPTTAAAMVQCGAAVMLLSSSAAFNFPGPAHWGSRRAARNGDRPVLQMLAGMKEIKKSYFAIEDVLLVERTEDDVIAFHEKERRRWLEVYDEVYVEAPQEFYPGDRVQVVSSVLVKAVFDDSVEDFIDAKGMQGCVVHYEFDDGYESCQTCSTSCPVTVQLDNDIIG
mmetsp:Transcript_49332/g.81920  ORF Transcript_49332/g.81920 Transcript_49332/m.81920 type:complete len:193 (+) Transcript_49332:45-623(+)